MRCEAKATGLFFARRLSFRFYKKWKLKRRSGVSAERGKSWPKTALLPRRRYANKIIMGTVNSHIGQRVAQRS
jgi:hypothetical protein